MNDQIGSFLHIPIGKIIPFFYKPHKPEISVLNPEDTEEREKNIRFEIIIFMLLLLYLFLRIVDIASIW